MYIYSKLKIANLIYSCVKLNSICIYISDGWDIREFYIIIGGWVWVFE